MKTAIFLMLFVPPIQSFGQECAPESQVRQVTDQLFRAMESGDSTSARAVFHPNARMQTSYIQRSTGKTVLIEGSLDEFIAAIGERKEDLWEERTANYSVHVDGQLAHIWMDYAFYLNGTFSHCGVNSFHLMCTEGTWQIIDVIDTRRSTNCIDL